MLKLKCHSGRSRRSRQSRSRFALMLAAIGTGGVLMPSPAQAQREIVQPLPPPEMADLRRALQRLAAEPRDIDALIEAGNASLALEDVDAAIGFFGRAETLAPGDARVKLGLAGAYVLTRRPIEALRLFHEAEQGGVDASRFAAKRGLAFDLVGDNASAQQQYQLALSRRDEPRVRERLAISQAVSGDRQGFEATLLPLLQARDVSAYRTRAFGLAILKREREAIDLAKEVMPPALAEAFIPYLRQMPQLSGVEQVAAIHLGVFPAKGQEGRTGNVVANQATAAPAGTISRRMTPAGASLGASSAADTRAVTAPEASVISASRPVVQSVPQSAAAAATPPRTVQPAPVVQQPRPALTDIFAGLNPSTKASAAPGAVDVTRLTIPRDPRPAPRPVPAAETSASSGRPAAAKPAPAPKPAHPARIWVQLAAGANRDAFVFDWRRLTREGGAALKGREAYTADAGRRHRLLIGPYPSAKAADEAVRALQTADIDALRFESTEGQEVIGLK